jgi:hypothetical protein
MPTRHDECFGLLAVHTKNTASTPEEQVLALFPLPEPTDMVIGYTYVRASFTKTTNLCQA